MSKQYYCFIEKIFISLRKVFCCLLKKNWTFGFMNSRNNIKIYKLTIYSLVKGEAYV